MTQEEILAEMNMLQAASTELAELNSTSATSFIEQLKKLFAYMSAKLFTMLIEHQKNVETIYRTNRFGSSTWYKEKLLSFQLGHSLSLIDGELKYVMIDTSTQIVKNVKFITSAFNNVLVVVSGKSFDSETRYQIPDEYVAAIQEYVNEIKILNATMTVKSYVADRIYLRIGINRNPLLIRDNGSRLTSSTTFPVRDFLATLINNYDGSIKPISKYYIQQQLMTMPEVKFADVSYMNTFSVTENNENGVGFDSVDSVSGTFYYDTNTIITYV
jgi:hypothetical protein